MAEVTFPENQLRNVQPELAVQIEDEIKAGASGQEVAVDPLYCRVLRQDWSTPRGRLTIQLGRTGWVTNFAVPAAPQPGQVRDAVARVLSGQGVP